jgi:hypothetical protein
MPFLAYELVHGSRKKYHSRYKFFCNVTISQRAKDSMRGPGAFCLPPPPPIYPLTGQPQTLWWTG